MGQKVNPIAFRLAVNKDWRSKWFAKGKDYTDKLHEDLAIRGYLKNKLINAGLARVVIERAWNSVRVTLHTSRPGLIIGRQGKEIEVMTKDLSVICKGAAQLNPTGSSAPSISSAARPKRLPRLIRRGQAAVSPAQWSQPADHLAADAYH